MSKRTDSINTLVVLSAGALLAACGGGGGSGGGDSVTTSSTPVTISASNAPEVAGAAYKTTTGLEGGGGGATGFLTGAVVENTSGGIDLVDVLISQVKEVPQLASAQATATLTGAVISQTVDCSNGGSISISFDDANNDQELSTGESLSLAANNCREDGMTMNGSVGIDNVTVTGSVTSPPYNMQFRIQANNFSVTEGAESVALNGGMTMSESSSDGILFTQSIIGTSIQVTEGGVTASLSSFSIAASENENTLAFTLDLNATVNSSELGGSVTMVTDTVFEGFALDYPSVGQATITGANNSSVTLIALDSVNVRLEIDADGDAVAETIVDTTWDTL